MVLIFAFVSLFFMPILGYLFVVALLAAIRKIVRQKPHGQETFWAGLLFGLIVWSIAFLTAYDLS